MKHLLNIFPILREIAPRMNFNLWDRLAFISLGSIVTFELFQQVVALVMGLAVGIPTAYVKIVEAVKVTKEMLREKKLANKKPKG